MGADVPRGLSPRALTTSPRYHMEGGEAEFQGDANIQTTAENKTMRELPEPHSTPLLQTRPRSVKPMSLRGQHSGLYHLTATQWEHCF